MRNISLVHKLKTLIKERIRIPFPFRNRILDNLANLCEEGHKFSVRLKWRVVELTQERYHQ